MSDVPKALHDRVVDRADGRCEYCQLSSKGQIAWFPIDHIKPQNQGGKTVFDNLALACPRCNQHKWAYQTGIDPETNAEYRLFNPRFDKWENHFVWDVKGGFPLIIGRDEIGRATVNRLKMNDPSILEIRKLLAGLGIRITKDPGGS